MSSFVMSYNHNHIFSDHTLRFWKRSSHWNPTIIRPPAQHSTVTVARYQNIRPFEIFPKSKSKLSTSEFNEIFLVIIACKRSAFSGIWKNFWLEQTLQHLWFYQTIGYFISSFANIQFNLYSWKSSKPRPLIFPLNTITRSQHTLLKLHACY